MSNASERRRRAGGDRAICPVDLRTRLSLLPLSLLSAAGLARCGHGAPIHIASVGQPEPTISASVQDQIREDLGLNKDNALYFAVLAVAERLKPGTFKSMVQSPHLIERQLVNFFDQF